MSPSTGPQISSICVSADSDELRLMLHHKFILIANTCKHTPNPRGSPTPSCQCRYCHSTGQNQQLGTIMLIPFTHLTSNRKQTYLKMEQIWANVQSSINLAYQWWMPGMSYPWAPLTVWGSGQQSAAQNLAHRFGWLTSGTKTLIGY